MEGYLGETEVQQKDVERFQDFDKSDWALYFIECYGQIDGAHHKAWVLDMCSRILNDSEVKIYKASWLNGHFEYRVRVGLASEKYLKWVEMMEDDGNYTYENGTAC